MTTATLEEESSITPELIIERLTEQMPEAWLPIHEEAMKAFKEQNYGKVRVLSASNLTDSYCKALSYLCSVPKMPPTLAVLLAEAARAIASAHEQQILFTLNSINAELLKT